MSAPSSTLLLQSSTNAEKRSQSATLEVSEGREENLFYWLQDFLIHSEIEHKVVAKTRALRQVCLMYSSRMHRKENIFFERRKSLMPSRSPGLFIVKPRKRDSLVDVQSTTTAPKKQQLLFAYSWIRTTSQLPHLFIAHFDEMRAPKTRFSYERATAEVLSAAYGALSMTSLF